MKKREFYSPTLTDHDMSTFLEDISFVQRLRVSFGRGNRRLFPVSGKIVSTNVMGLPLAGLISPLLSLPLTVPAVTLLGE